MTTILLLLLTLAALCAYRWRCAQTDADYWRSQSLFWQGQAHRATLANLEVEQECRRLYGESLRVVGRREALWGMVREPGEN